MSNFWDREIIEKQHVAWMGIPRVRFYLNQRVAGGQPLWPIELLELFLRGRTFERGLSIGCGSGELERQLIERGFCRSFEAFDGSVASLAIAHREATRLRMQVRIRYFAADFNVPALPKSRYDIVFFHQSAHHVGKLEKLFRALMRSLKPGGLVYFDEYVGPSRFEWATKPELLQRQLRVFNTIPNSLLRLDLARPVRFRRDRPFELVDSVFRPLAVEAQIRENHAQDSAAVVLLPHHIETNLLATPKRGVRAVLARARYWLEPKVKRVIIEVRRAIRD